MNKKYKITELWRGTYDAHYIVKVKGTVKGFFDKLTVKYRNPDQYAEYRDNIECKITRHGEDFKVKTERSEFVLDICEIHAMRAAFLALYEAEGGSVVVKEKKVCTCGG